MTHRHIHELRERYPDPGPDPVARLRHVVDVFADEAAGEMAVLATSGIHESGKTGLTWGDLRALLEVLGRGTRFVPAITQSAAEFKAATDAYMELGLDDEDARDTDEFERYHHTAVVLASIVAAEIERRKVEGEQ